VIDEPMFVISVVVQEVKKFPEIIGHKKKEI